MRRASCGMADTMADPRGFRGREAVMHKGIGGAASKRLALFASPSLWRGAGGGGGGGTSPPPRAARVPAAAPTPAPAVAGGPPAVVNPPTSPAPAAPATGGALA